MTHPTPLDPARQHPALQDWPVLELYKSDHRSRVWRSIDSTGQEVVIKQFVHAPLKQAWERLWRWHPVQREVRALAALRRDGLPAAEVLDHGPDFLITPHLGTSLHNRLKHDHWPEGWTRERALAAAESLLNRLKNRGWAIRDFKASNLMLDDAGKLWIIDAESAKRTRRPAAVARMEQALHDSIRIATGVGTAKDAKIAMKDDNFKS